MKLWSCGIRRYSRCSVWSHQQKSRKKWCNQGTIQKVRESQAESILHDKCEWEAFEQHFCVNPRTVGTSSTNDAGLWQVAGCTRREFWRCDQLLKRPHSHIKHRPLGAQGDNMQNTLHLAAPTSVNIQTNSMLAPTWWDRNGNILHPTIGSFVFQNTLPSCPNTKVLVWNRASPSHAILGPHDGTAPVPPSAHSLEWWKESAERQAPQDRRRWWVTGFTRKKFAPHEHGWSTQIGKFFNPLLSCSASS